MDLATAFTATVAAIGTFLATGAQEVGKQVILDTYEKLKKTIQSKFGSESQSARAIKALEEDPDSKAKQRMLAGIIEIEEVDKDADVAQMALELSRLLKTSEIGKNALQKYNVDAKWAQIGGIGDHWRVGKMIFNMPSSTDTHGYTSADWESFYLKRLVERCDPLELTALEEICPGDSREIRVSDVFTTLYLKDVERTEVQTVAEALSKPHGDPEKLSRRDEEKKRIPIQAIEAAGAMPRLVILGRPGGGKSTLVNHLATQTARLRMGETIPDDRLPGWPIKENLLPVRIVLRRFAAWIPKGCKAGTEGLVWDYVKHQLGEWGCEAFHDHLKHTLDTGGGVIFFDGLDEVSERDEQRSRTLIVQAIQAFAKPLKKCRVIITCRQYAYKQSDGWHLPKAEFPEVELDLFRSAQIEHFTQTWYCIVGRWRDWNDAKCLDEAGNLYRAIEAWPHLKELGQYPLLLTLMAQVHGRDGYLPRDRADLYDRAVKLLLVHWDNRLVRDQDGTCKIEQGLIARLGFRSDALRITLERVALAPHEQQEKATERTGCADIGKEDLRDALRDGLTIDLNRAEEVIAYIQDRAGLLQAEDNRIFRFPHRTFQEYLAACCIMKKGNFEAYLKERVERDMEWWREVFLLAAGSSRNTPKNIFDMVDTLLPSDPSPSALTSKIAACAGLAAQAMAETEFLTHVKAERDTPGRYTRIHGRVQAWLHDSLTADGMLSPRERVAAGNALNWVTDPRFDPGRWSLPKEENDGFINIGSGEFWMGSDQKKDKTSDYREFPRHRVRLGTYAMARYPVTVAQYECFARETARELDQAWRQVNRYDNHPVVRVSWDDAKAYCRWLAGKLGKQVVMPSEAQWEMVARGTVGRIYPWGDDAVEPNRANYNDTGINETSPVGVFPMGGSYCGAMDMVGNVWEWVEDDWHKNYHDAPINGTAWVDDPRGSYRVVRGGAWNFSARDCRAAFRSRFEPGSRRTNLGFRLALLPGQQR